MLNGVTVMDQDSTFIDASAQLGRDTVLYPNVHIEGKTSIASGCTIYPNSRICNCTIEENVTIKDSSLLVDSTVRSGASVGPFAHIRPGTTIGEKAKIGNFVEVKKSNIGACSKASHLSYIGDADVGAGVNIGAGTITCNYDGVNKFRTTIEDGVFIGSDSQLVAPVTVGKDAYVGAGSTITKNVPAGALGLCRARQANIQGWADRRKKLMAKKSAPKGDSHGR
jgi:bifunctional UDP-N-acetylglucosamine pyrophosphorylase/glucosamine-1-phosphate N-acetyltransferase